MNATHLSSVENGKRVDLSIAEIFDDFLEDSSGGGIMLTDKPQRRETQVRKDVIKGRGEGYSLCRAPEWLWDRRQYTAFPLRTET